jgi:putative transposase
MPRAPRLDAPRALHHIITRGIERRRIFCSRSERLEFLDRLAPLVLGSRASLAAWCVMGNHLHLLLRTGAMPLSHLMNRLLGGYARRFNMRHQRVGHLFQGRFKSTVVEDDPYLLELVRYIHLNPLRARIVPDLDTLAHYPWSGHAVLMGTREYSAQDTRAVLGLFASEPAPARRAYRAFVAQHIRIRAIRNSEGAAGRSTGTREAHAMRA